MEYFQRLLWDCLHSWKATLRHRRPTPRCLVRRQRGRPLLIQLRLSLKRNYFHRLYQWYLLDLPSPRRLLLYNLLHEIQKN